MANEIKTHRDLLAWQHAFELGLRLHEISLTFPPIERFVLADQIRRAGFSIASNISEGYGRGRTLDYLRFLRMARGSLFEVDTQLCFALRLGYIERETFGDMQERIQETGRVLAGLIRSIESSRQSRGSGARKSDA
jgi:four helix bundle protein